MPRHRSRASHSQPTFEDFRNWVMTRQTDPYRDLPPFWFVEIFKGVLGKLFMLSVVVGSATVVFVTRCLELHVLSTFFHLILYNWLIVNIFHYTRVYFFPTDLKKKKDANKPTNLKRVLNFLVTHMTSNKLYLAIIYIVVALFCATVACMPVYDMALVFRENGGTFPEKGNLDSNIAILEVVADVTTSTVDSFTTTTTTQQHVIEIAEGKPGLTITSMMYIPLVVIAIFIFVAAIVTNGRQRIMELQYAVEEEFAYECIVYERTSG